MEQYLDDKLETFYNDDYAGFNEENHFGRLFYYGDVIITLYFQKWGHYYNIDYIILEEVFNKPLSTKQYRVHERDIFEFIDGLLDQFTPRRQM